MSRSRVSDRIRALEGKILVPREAAVRAGRVPGDTIHAVVETPEAELPRGQRQVLAVAWPVRLTHRGWCHPALDGFHSAVCQETFVGARARIGLGPSVLPRAHLDYTIATPLSIAVMEARGVEILAAEDAARVLVRHGIYPRSGLLDELVRAVLAAAKGGRPADTLGSLSNR